MTARPEILSAFSTEPEASWAEDVDIWGTRHEIIGKPTLSLNQERIAQDTSRQYREEAKAGVLGPRGGTVSVTYALTGHGGTTAGALTETDIATILSRFFGGINVADSGDTVGSATSASQFAPTAETYSAGALIRVGAIGDGRCEGQWAAVNDGSTATMLTALPATPNAADVIYTSQVVFPTETPAGDAIASMRMLVQTANKQYKLRGVYPMSGTIQGNNTGEAPTITIEYGISWFDYANEVFPNLTSTDAKDSSIVSNGTVFIQDVGTVTRDTHCVRSWSIDIAFEVAPLSGCNAVNEYQITTGAVRTKCAASLTITVDAEAPGTETFGDKFRAGTLQHILIGLSVADGKALALYFPNCRIPSHPVQVGSDGLNRETVTFEALTGPNKSTALAMSSFRIGLG